MTEPAARSMQGSEEEVGRVFAEANRQHHNHIQLFASPPIDQLDASSIKRSMDGIHDAETAAESA